MPLPVAAVKMVPVAEDSFVAVNYMAPARQLRIAFRNGTTLLCHNVPGFRYDGWLAAPRKEAYFKTFIEHQFLAQPAPPPDKVDTSGTCFCGPPALI